MNQHPLLLTAVLLLNLVIAHTLTPAVESCGQGEYLYTRSYRRRRSGGRNSCKPCTAGHYKSFTHHTDSYCEKCESGRYQHQIGQIDCFGSKCPAGRFGLSGQVHDSISSCSDCIPGRFSTSFGHESCASCPAGLYSSPGTATNCLGDTICPAGKWGSIYAIKPNS